MYLSAFVRIGRPEHIFLFKLEHVIVSQYSPPPTRLQCRNGNGACPDEDHFSGSCSNDIVSVSGSRQGDQQCVIYTRNFSTSECVTNGQTESVTIIIASTQASC